ncbi:protein of unknown function DUF224 cysteine-rich region domain protein [Syntrophobotulus glycolicus DSM 8271]|uniref:Cysteine-rich domain-containing protein n=2 Tax=Syntrophobotulus TaxID=51196 RepID=F0T1I3_SYNGF|nr:protein of unknown function DUF224 cysteine-rich region domain protein [Syntrophobotulus glycolicus DSM 8271]
MAGRKKLPATFEIIRGNIMKYGNPLALNGKEISSWAKELNLPTTGKLLFYTGGEYQLLPYIDSLVKTMSIIDPNSGLFSLLMKVRGLVNKTGINAEKIYASILAKDKQRYRSINYKAAVILKRLGYDLCYNGAEELYSGALLYELGFWKDLKKHAPKVIEYINKTGAETIICLSPHAAEMFKLIFPEMTGFPDVKVRTFVDMVAEKANQLPKIKLEKPVVIHDSCRLARDLGVFDEIRVILEAMGAEYVEPLRNKDWTTCCGGPSKLLFPDVSKVVSGRRITELAETGADRALISCPYCLSALEGGLKTTDDSLILEDLVEFIYRGFEDNERVE